MNKENFILGTLLLVLTVAVFSLVPRAIDKENQFYDERTAQHLEQTKEEVK